VSAVRVECERVVEVSESLEELVRTSVQLAAPLLDHLDYDALLVERQYDGQGRSGGFESQTSLFGCVGVREAGEERLAARPGNHARSSGGGHFNIVRSFRSDPHALCETPQSRGAEVC
jgi:hypothetical protein